MNTVARIVGAAPCRLWGIDGAERLRRQLAQSGMVVIDDDMPLPATATRVVVANAAYLFEILTLSGLAEHDRALLECPDDQRIAAAVVPIAELGTAIDTVRNSGRPAGDITLLGPADLAGYDRRLRKSAPPLLTPVSVDQREVLEARLYGNAYKGITDLITKWAWPRPARAVVGWCARLGVTPNMVTLTGLMLVVVATCLFYAGAFASGLVCAWIMTLLDTVDGKLARVTVMSSRFGHILDHGIDLIHPPFWYAAWGLGLGMDSLMGLPIETWCWLVGSGYVAGRLLEALFHQLGHCGIFAWRPFDAYFRLVTARRNPCLIILTVLLAAGRADLAFVGVAGWTLLSSAILMLRLLYAVGVRWRTGPLDSWLKDADRARREHPHAWRTFSATRGAYR
ncbi:MAG: CDP-alcohol phosphatidyltransferase family protein [Gammaproteobacteria bacterium]